MLVRRLLFLFSAIFFDDPSLSAGSQIETEEQQKKTEQHLEKEHLKKVRRKDNRKEGRIESRK